jgi:hypothetical protein
MGDFSDLANHDAALKIWLPEPVKHALDEISERSDLIFTAIFGNSLLWAVCVLSNDRNYA